jgi:hypothetical protein
VELAELVEATLDGVAVLVGLGVEDRRAPALGTELAAVGLLVLLDGDHRFNTTSVQIGAVGARGVGLITHRRPGSALAAR